MNERIKKIRKEALKEGAVVEIKVTDPDGKEYSAWSQAKKIRTK